MKFFEGWRELNRRLNASNLTAPTQLVMYKLFYMFDEQRFPESLLVSDRELMSVANIKSTKTIVEARRQLKNLGLIDFETAHGKPTRYRPGKTIEVTEANDENVNSLEICADESGNTLETLGKHLVNTLETPAPNSNIRARAANPDPDPLPVGELYRRETGKEIFGSALSELENLCKVYGHEKFRRALVETVKAQPRNFDAYIRAVLKGGDKSVRVDKHAGRARTDAVSCGTGANESGRFDDKKPDYGWLYEGCSGTAEK